MSSEPDIRLGRWQDVLSDAHGDLLCADPPYGAGTHAATNEHIAGSALPDGCGRKSMDYEHWSAADVHAFVGSWAPRIRGWMCCFTSDDLIPEWKAAYLAAGRYAFAPVPVIQPRPRLVGDGPASWTVYLMTARPRNREFATWGCLPGAYFSRTDRTGIVCGAKPLDLMRQIIADYSRPNETVIDTHGGGFTTAIACRLEGRRCISSELDPVTFAKGERRVRHGSHAAKRPEQGVLW